MPDIEITLIVITLATAALIRIRPIVARYQRVSLLCLIGVVVLAQLASMGPHWQLLPEYAAVILLTLRLWRRRPSRLLPAIAFFLCLVSLAAMWILPVFSLPKPTGSYAAGTTGPVHWTDFSRNIAGEPGGAGRPRELTVQIWYPATAGLTGKPARYARFRELNLARSYESVIRTNALLDAPVADSDEPFPVLLFGHRWGGSRTQDTFLVEELASHGYVVVAVDHPLNAARVLMSDGSVIRSDRINALNHLEATTSAAVRATWAKELTLWTADDEFALNQLGQLHPFSSRLNLANVGAFGHSFGGASSLALLGVDPRVKCAVNLDGWTFNALDRRTTQPILAVYEGSSEIRRPETGVAGELDRADNAAVDASLARFGGLRAYVTGAQHLDFTDQTLVSPIPRLTFTGPIKGKRIRTITRGLVLGFFDQNLKQTGSIPSYPEVKMGR